MEKQIAKFWLRGESQVVVETMFGELIYVDVCDIEKSIPDGVDKFDFLNDGCYENDATIMLHNFINR